MNARRFYLDVREDGEVILTAQPSTRFDDPPAVVRRGNAARGDGFSFEMAVGSRRLKVAVTSHPPVAP